MTENSPNLELASRRQKLEHLQKQGINPYPSQAHKTHAISAVLENFEKLEQEQTMIALAGRLRLFRAHGKSAFANIEDESGSLQIYFQQDVLGEDLYRLLEDLDLGDFLSVTGKVFITKKGEKTLRVEKFEILCKTLRPLPDKWHGLKDQELRYRKRYLDLVMSPETRDLFRKKSAFVKNIRAFLDTASFLEVTTPILEHIPGGAEAEPFVTHHNTLDVALYLRISLELHLKRLIVGGYEKIYELGRVFRNEGMSTQHLQEFDMLELYWAYADWNMLMEFTEKLLADVIQKTFGTLKIVSGGTELNFEPPFARVNYVDAVREKTGIDIEEHETAESLRKAITEKGLKLEDPDAGRGRLIDQFYKKYVRPQLIQPVFLVNHPVDVSPLAKKDPQHPQRTERFHFIVAGAEIINGFSELNDPVDQRERFLEQASLRTEGDKEAYMFDEDFLQAIEHGMPPTAGLGMGIERFFSLLADQESVRDVVFFPTMKPKESTSEEI